MNVTFSTHIFVNVVSPTLLTPFIVLRAWKLEPTWNPMIAFQKDEFNASCGATLVEDSEQLNG